MLTKKKKKLTHNTIHVAYWNYATRLLALHTIKRCGTSRHLNGASIKLKDNLKGKNNIKNIEINTTAFIAAAYNNNSGCWWNSSQDLSSASKP